MAPTATKDERAARTIANAEKGRMVKNSAEYDADSENGTTPNFIAAIKRHLLHRRRADEHRGDELGERHIHQQRRGAGGERLHGIGKGSGKGS